MPRHSETRVMPYTADQMYTLVADVAAYPQFLPWCSAARIRKLVQIEHGREMNADLVISFKVFRERFGSRVILCDRLKKIDTEYIDGPFKFMTSSWAFQDRVDGGCDVSFFVDFEFKNIMLKGVIGVVFNDAMQRVVRSFEARAAELYS